MDKQQVILQAALALFVSNGFHGTPTSRVAQEAGVSNGTLFHYFKTKDELVVALYNQVKEELSAYLLARFDPSAPLQEQFRALFVESINWGLQNQQAFFYIQQFHFSPHLAQVSADVIAQQTQLHRTLIQRGVQEGILKTLPEALIFSVVSSQVFGTCQYVAGLPSEQQATAIHDTYRLVWEAIRA